MSKEGLSLVVLALGLTVATSAAAQAGKGAETLPSLALAAAPPNEGIHFDFRIGRPGEAAARIGSPIAASNLNCDFVGNACLLNTGGTGSIPDQASLNVPNAVTRGVLEGFFGTSNCTIARTKEAVEINHSDVGDLGVFLFKEGFSTTQAVDLYTPPFSCNANKLDAIFRDGSPGAAANTCPFTSGGLLRPVEPLSTFNGQSVADTYTLQVGDFAAGDVGTLQAWRQAWDLTCSPLSPPTTCSPSSTALCLQGNRFRITAEFRTSTGQSGQGQRFLMTADSGAFSFFDPNNVEIVTKVLNGCGLNGKYWVFIAGLTNVRVYITVVDLVRDTAITFTNPLNTNFVSIYHTSAFDC